MAKDDMVEVPKVCASETHYERERDRKRESARGRGRRERERERERERGGYIWPGLASMLMLNSLHAE